MIELLHCDCMEYMATVPDKYFDISIVDPPYGIGENGYSVVVCYSAVDAINTIKAHLEHQNNQQN